MWNSINSKERDISKDFFQNFHTLFHNQQLPFLRIFWPGVENCAYSDTCYNAKNCYLTTVAAFDVENACYNYHVSGNSKNVFNSVFVNTNSENVYQSSDITSSQSIFFSSSVNNCYNIRYSHNLIGCQECIACEWLFNQSYCIENIAYSKEQYFLKKQDMLHEYNHGRKIVRYKKSNNSCFQCDELENGMFCSYVKNGRNVCFVSRDDNGEKRYLYDTMSSGGQIDSAYACMGVSPGDNFYCCINSAFCSHIYYCMFMANCSFCLGCIWLKNKSYCLLNKQLEKDERYEKVDLIFAQMEKTPLDPPFQGGGSLLGAFFPWSLCPFYFNDTMASLIDDSFTKEEVMAEGYLRRDEEIKVDIPEWMEVVKSDELSTFEQRKTIGDWDHNGWGRNLDSSSSENFSSEWQKWKSRWIDPAILKKVIRDEKGNVYRVIKMEYDFLMKYWLPLPREHRLDRLKGHFKIK